MNDFMTSADSVDYVNCIRKFLLQLNNSGPKESSFHPRPEHHARPTKPKHPWEFDYKRTASNAVHESHPSHLTEKKEDEGLYWKSACLQPRSDVKKAVLEPTYHRGKKIHASELMSKKGGYTEVDKNKFFKQIENPKTLHACRKVYNDIGGDSKWKILYKEFKKYAEAPRNTSITYSIDVLMANFHKVFSETRPDIQKSDIYTLGQKLFALTRCTVR